MNTQLKSHACAQQYKQVRWPEIILRVCRTSFIILSCCSIHKDTAADHHSLPPSLSLSLSLSLQKEHSSVATYIQNPVSLHQMSYHCAFLVARKPARNHTLSRPSGTEPSAAVLPSREDTTPLNTQARVKGQTRIRGQSGVRVQAASTSAAARAPSTQARGQASSSTAANTHTSSSLLEVAASRRGPSSIAPNTDATFTAQASSIAPNTEATFTAQASSIAPNTEATFTVQASSIAPNTEATGNCNGEWPGLD